VVAEAKDGQKTTRYIHQIYSPNIFAKYIRQVYSPSIFTKYIHQVYSPSIFLGFLEIVAFIGRNEQQILLSFANNNCHNWAECDRLIAFACKGASRSAPNFVRRGAPRATLNCVSRPGGASRSAPTFLSQARKFSADHFTESI